MKNHTVSRRTMLKMTTAAASAALLPATAGAAISQATSRPHPIGVQLYTLRTLMEKDVAQTLATVGEIGYREVEFAGYFGQPLASIRQWLADSGLTAPSAHIRHTDFKTRFDEVLEETVTMGHKNLFLSWLPPEDRTLDRYREIAELLNTNGDKAKAAGVQLGYHNHEFEFDLLDGTRGYDVLMGETDPDLVKFELDVYWLQVAGVDPFSLINSHPGRFPCVHVKDYGANGKIVDVGDGIIDFEAIYAARKKAGIQHFFVEHDSPENPVRTITRSFAALSHIIR